MTDLVDPANIEQLVGIKRHPTDHYARAVSAEGKVFILHSAECRDSGRDLRECPYSRALDEGITPVWGAWCGLLDTTVRVTVSPGHLLPDSDGLS